MADTRTRPGTDRRPLIAYLRVQRDREREMIAALTRSANRMNAELRRLESRPGIGAAVRRDQIAGTLASVHNELADLWRQLGHITLAGKADAAAAAVEAMYPRSLLGAIFSAEDQDYMRRSAQAAARATAGTLEARLGISKIPLAQSVYRNRELTSGKVDDIVNSVIARGGSARDIARDVRRFVRPDVRGGVRYAALRLGRTELNNAFHAQQVQSGIETPWTTGLLWNLSGSHPRPDECNEYADSVHEEGKPAGVYSPENVPAKPHPNCLCFTTPVTVDRDTFIRQFQAGQYDDIVDRMIRNGGITIR